MRGPIDFLSVPELWNDSVLCTDDLEGAHGTYRQPKSNSCGAEVSVPIT